jgi:uncharacterized protein
VRFLLDVNLLMALLWEDHEHHGCARKWFSGVREFATCPLTQLGFARLSSHPALGYGLSADRAFEILRGLLADPRHQFVADSISCTDSLLRTDMIHTSGQVTDHYLRALARQNRQNRLALATLDRELAARFRAEPDIVCLVEKQG